MSDTPKKFGALLEGEVQVSLINEPIVHFVIDHEVKAESATARARRRWHMTEEGEAHERE